jgi:hypothetical protein
MRKKRDSRFRGNDGGARLIPSFPRTRESRFSFLEQTAGSRDDRTRIAIGKAKKRDSRLRGNDEEWPTPSSAHAGMTLLFLIGPLKRDRRRRQEEAGFPLSRE